MWDPWGKWGTIERAAWGCLAVLAGYSIGSGASLTNTVARWGTQDLTKADLLLVLGMLVLAFAIGAGFRASSERHDRDKAARRKLYEEWAQEHAAEDDAA